MNVTKRKQTHRYREQTAAASFQSCPTLCDPIGFPSLGFSRQEHWSELPFPSPVHESEKWKWSRSVVSDPQRPHGLQPTRLLRPWGFPGKSTGVGCHCLRYLINANVLDVNLTVPDLLLRHVYIQFFKNMLKNWVWIKSPQSLFGRLQKQSY